MNAMHPFYISVQLLKVLLIKSYKIQPYFLCFTLAFIHLQISFLTTFLNFIRHYYLKRGLCHKISFFNGFTQRSHPLNSQNLLSLFFVCSLVQNSVQQNYLPELYPLYSPSYQKFSIYFHFACSPHHPAQQHKKCLFSTPEKFLSPNSNFHVITQYKLHL